MFQVLQYITTKSCLGAKDEDGDDEDMDGNQENGDKAKRPEMESETPWVSLASLALFKLFNDWQAQVCHKQDMLLTSDPHFFYHYAIGLKFRLN